MANVDIKKGNLVKVEFTDTWTYVAEAEVIELKDFGEFIGLVRHLFDANGGEINADPAGSGPRERYVGREKTFRVADVLKKK